MVIDFTAPWLQLFAVPFLLGLAGHGLIIFFCGREGGSFQASNGLLLGFICAALLIVGLPALPPAAYVDVLLWTSIALTVFGWLLDRPNGKDILPPVLAFLSMGLVLWALYPDIKSDGISDSLPKLVIAGGLSCLLFFRLYQESDYNQNAPYVICAIAFGLAGIAYVTPSPLLQNLAPMTISANLSYILLCRLGLPSPYNLAPVLVMAATLVIVALGLQGLQSSLGAPLCLLTLSIWATPLSSWHRTNCGRPQTAYVFWLIAPPVFSIIWAAVVL